LLKTLTFRTLQSLHHLGTICKLKTLTFELLHWKPRNRAFTTRNRTFLFDCKSYRRMGKSFWCFQSQKPNSQSWVGM
jgi:hypothetical protein